MSPLRSRVILAIDIAAALVAYRRVHSSMPWHVPYNDTVIGINKISTIINFNHGLFDLVLNSAKYIPCIMPYNTGNLSPLHPPSSIELLNSPQIYLQHQLHNGTKIYSHLVYRSRYGAEPMAGCFVKEEQSLYCSDGGCGIG